MGQKLSWFLQVFLKWNRGSYAFQVEWARENGSFAELVLQQKMSPGLLGPLYFLPIHSFSCFSLTIFHDDTISNIFLILCFGWYQLPGYVLCVEMASFFFVFSLHLILAWKLYPSFFMQFLKTLAMPWILLFLVLAKNKKQQVPSDPKSWKHILWYPFTMETLSLRVPVDCPHRIHIGCL